MRRRMLSLLLVLCMVLGMMPVAVLAEEVTNSAPAPGENISLSMRLNEWYDMDLSELFTDSEGDALVYEVSTDGTNWIIVNPTYSYYPAGTGTQKVFFHAVDTYGNVSESLTLTADVEAPPSTVTVSLSISQGTNGLAYCSETDTVMTPMELTVPYFDLGLYGLEKYYYNPLCYSTHKEGDTEHSNSQLAGTKETAHGIVTLMHVFIYATERFYLGRDAADCGNGTSYEEGFFDDAISWTGGVGSSYMTLWDHGTNLNYYVNWEFPLGAKGWGSTSDQIALYGGEKINGHMIMNSGASGTNFSFFTVDGQLSAEHQVYETTVKKGDTLELTAVRAVAKFKEFSADYVAYPEQPVYMCKETNVQSSLANEKWSKLDGVTGEDGKFLLDTSEMDPGTYYVAAEGKYDQDNGVEVAPALIKVTVKAPPDAALEIIQNGQNIETKKTGIVYNEVNVYFAELPDYMEFSLKDGLSGNGTERLFQSLEGTAQSNTVMPVVITSTKYESTKAVIENTYGNIEGLDGEDTYLQAFEVYSLNDKMQADALLYVLIVEMPVKRVKTLTLNETSISLAGGEQRQLTAELDPTDATFSTVTWMSSNTESVEIAEDGTITAYTAGTSVITATADGISAQCTVTVTKSYPRPTVIYNSNAAWPATNLCVSKLTVNAAAVDSYFADNGNIYVSLDPAALPEDGKILLDIGYTCTKGSLYIRVNGENVNGAPYTTSGAIRQELLLENDGTSAEIAASSDGETWVTKTVEFSTDGTFEIAPILSDVSSVSALVAQGDVYTLNLESVFLNFSKQEMTYTVSVDGANAITYSETGGYLPETTGQHTLVFTADNTIGISPTYTVYLNVIPMNAVYRLNRITENGGVAWFAFTDENGEYIEGSSILFDADTKTFDITLPEDINLTGNVITYYKSNGSSFFTSSNQISGTNIWSNSICSQHKSTLTNGNVRTSIYFYDHEPTSTANSYETYYINYARILPDTHFEYVIDSGIPSRSSGDSGKITKFLISGDAGGVLTHQWHSANTALHILLTEETPDDGKIINNATSTQSVRGDGEVTLNEGTAIQTIESYHPTWNDAISWTVKYQKDNLPVRAENVNATVDVTIPCLDAYEVDLTSLFVDPDEGDLLSYQVKIGNGAWKNFTGSTYSYTPQAATSYKLAFRAYDGFAYSEETYTINITATNATTTYDVTVGNLPEGALFYCNVGFSSGIDILGEQLSAQQAEDGAYTVQVPTNVTRITIVVGDARITAAVSAENTQNFIQMQKTTFQVVTGAGDPADATVTVIYGNSYKATGNGNVYYLVAGSGYTFTASPTEDYSDTWSNINVLNQTITADAEATVELKLSVKSAKTITIDQGAEVKVYYQRGYYVMDEVQPVVTTVNVDGTTTYTYSCPNGQAYSVGYMYFATKPGLIDKAGYMNSVVNTTITWDGDTRTGAYRGDYDLSTTMGSRSDDSVMVNVNRQNHLVLNPGDTFRLRAFRIWEIINSDTENVMIEPEFTFSGYNPNLISLTSANEALVNQKCGVSGNNWMDMTVKGAGTTFLEVGYEAVHIVDGYSDGSWGGAAGQSGDFTYNASDPARTALVVIQTDGKAATDVSFGIDCFSSNSENKVYVPECAVAWDAEFDTVYFTGRNGEITLSPSVGSGGIASVALSNDKGSHWQTLSMNSDGKYVADIYSGNNVIRVTKTDGTTAYQVIRGDKITYDIALQSDVNSDGITGPGDTVRVTLNGLHNPIGKMSGIYNPGYGKGQRVTYTWNGATAQQRGYYQYDFVTNAWVDVTIPEDATGEYALTDGYINFNVLGDAPGNHRNLTDNGRAINTTANEAYYTRSILPDIMIYDIGNRISIDDQITHGTVNASTYLAEAGETVTLTVKPEDCYTLSSLLVTDADGNSVTVENMTFTMPESSVTVTAEFVSVGLGNVTKDDAISEADAMLIYSYVTSGAELTENQLAIADVNGDGFVDTTDAALVYRFANSTLDKFPVNGKEGE